MGSPLFKSNTVAVFHKYPVAQGTGPTQRTAARPPSRIQNRVFPFVWIVAFDDDERQFDGIAGFFPPILRYDQIATLGFEVAVYFDLAITRLNPRNPNSGVLCVGEATEQGHCCAKGQYIFHRVFLLGKTRTH